MALEKSVNIRAIQRYRSNCEQSFRLFPGGFIISAFTYNIYVLFVTFGIMCGTAQSLSIVGGASILYYYFEEKRGLATSKNILILRISMTFCLWALKNKTRRMHSSRMRTTRSLTASRSIRPRACMPL